MASKIAQRIERELQLPGLVDALANRLSPSDLRSLLIEVYNERSHGISEAALAAQAARDPLLVPSAVDARHFLAFDTAAFGAASAFAALDLSPVCPLSAAYTLGGTSQNNLLTTIRNAEVLGDSTIAMALEAVRRRKSGEVVRLCASQRLIRLQPFDGPGFSPHFRLFGMVSAGRDTGSFRFEIAEMIEHVRVYLRLFRGLNKLGFSFAAPLVEFADMASIEAALQAAGITRDEVRASVRAVRGGTEDFVRERGIELDATGAETRELLKTGVIEPLRHEFPDAEFRVNQQRLEGFGYYRSFTLRISPQAPDGNRYAIMDGGFTDWTARLSGNRKERLLISGIGSEFACKMYRAR